MTKLGSQFTDSHHEGFQVQASSSEEPNDTNQVLKGFKWSQKQHVPTQTKKKNKLKKHRVGRLTVQKSEHKAITGNSSQNTRGLKSNNWIKIRETLMYLYRWNKFRQSLPKCLDRWHPPVCGLIWWDSRKIFLLRGDLPSADIWAAPGLRRAVSSSVRATACKVNRLELTTLCQKQLVKEAR